MKNLLLIMAVGFCALSNTNSALAAEPVCSILGLQVNVNKVLVNGLSRPTQPLALNPQQPSLLSMSCSDCAQAADSDNFSERKSYAGPVDARGDVGPKYFYIFLSHNLDDALTLPNPVRLGMLTGEFSDATQSWSIHYLPEEGRPVNSLDLSCL
jgi:hypothetical protein